jgi:hypothetical protein
LKEYEADGAVNLTTQDGETTNIFLDDYVWKRVYHCVQCLHYGVTKLKFDACGLERTSTPAIQLLDTGFVFILPVMSALPFVPMLFGDGSVGETRLGFGVNEILHILTELVFATR